MHPHNYVFVLDAWVQVTYDTKAHDPVPDTPRGLPAIVATPRDHLRVTTTPLWVPLAVAALGLLGTVVGAISGVLITQRRADKREVEAWERESQRERERWAREDAARTFEQRRDAYIDFYRANGDAGREVHSYLSARVRGFQLKDEVAPSSWVPEAEEKLSALAIYGSQRVLDLAHDAQFQYRMMATEAREWKTEDGIGPLDRRGDEWSFARDLLLQAMRSDLGIPEDESGRSVSRRDLPHLARIAASAAAEA
jgi:hypothetical protein